MDINKEFIDTSAIIIDGNIYHDGGYKIQEDTEFPFKSFLGFAGKKFSIKMNTGEVLQTNNLFCNGSLPEGSKVKDNAVFIDEPETNTMEAIISKLDFIEF